MIARTVGSTLLFATAFCGAAAAFSNQTTAISANPLPTPLPVDYAFNKISIPHDTLAGKTYLYGVSALSIIQNFGAGTGSRNTLLVQGTLEKPMQTGSDSQFFVAAYLREIAFAGDGGRPGRERGAIFALNPVAEAHPGALDLLEVAGAEVNVALLPNSSSARRTGIRLASGGDLRAKYLDSGLDFSGGKVGWGFGILFQSELGRNPVDGVLIGAHADNTPLVAASGIDFGEYRFTSGVSLNLPGGFVVRDGRLEAPELTASTMVVKNPASPSPDNQAVFSAPTSTYSDLGEGKTGYIKICTDCRKPQEEPGHGSGMLLFFDGRQWASSATGAPAAH